MSGRDFTPDNELRYLQIADEAIENGSVFTFTNDGRPYADKPPLFLWLVMLLKWAVGRHNILILSLLAFIPAAVIACVMDRWLLLAYEEKGRSADPGTRLAMVLMLFTSGMFCGTCFFLRMDMLMTMFIILAFYSFYRSYTFRRDSALQSWLLPLWIFLALFTKGPVGLLMPLLGIAVFLIIRRDANLLGKYLGLKTFGVLILLCALWFGGVLLEGGKDYLYELTVHQTVGRGINAFTHAKPFWYYFEALPINFAPYVLFSLPIIIISYIRPYGRTIMETLLLGSALTTFIMLSCFSSKLAIYLLPIVPGLTYCIPLTIERLGWKGWMSACLKTTIVILSLIGALGLIAVLVLPRPAPQPGIISELQALLASLPPLTSPAAISAMAILLAGALFCLFLCSNRAHWSAPVASLATTILLTVFAASFAIKDINPYIGYGSVCAQVPESGRVVTLFVKRSENMKVYLHRDIVRYEKDVDAFLKGEALTEAEPSTLIITTERLAENPALQEFLRSREKRRVSVGEYSVIEYQLRPDGQ